MVAKDELRPVERDLGSGVSGQYGMGAAERRRWSSVLRQDLAGSIIVSLKDPALRGVVVIGEQGVGKTTLARSVERLISASTYSLHMHGTTGDTAVPYGQMAFLLARLPAATMESPATIIRGISQLIQVDAAGREVLLVLDDLPGMDVMSIAVLTHLLISGSAKMLILARALSDLPEDFIRLLKDHKLKSLRLENFARHEVAQLLEAVLGNRITKTALSVFYAKSKGNPLVLQAIVSEQIRSGNLHRAGTVWGLRGEIRLASGDSLAALVRMRLTRARAEVCTGVECLALVRKIPLAVLMKILDASVVAEMEEAGFLQVDESERRWASLPDEYVGEIIRGWLDMPRRGELYQLASSVAGTSPERMNRDELLSYAAWTLDCGEQLPPAIALAASTAAIQVFDPKFALDCAEQISPCDREWVAAAQQRGAAYLILGETRSAVKALEEVTTEQLEGLQISEYGSYVMDQSNCLLRTPGGYQRIRDLLVCADAEIERRERNSSSAVTAGEIVRAKEFVRLADYELSVHQGSFKVVAEPLEKAYREGSGIEYRFNCASLLVLVWALTGREMDAIALAAELQEKLQYVSVIPRLREWWAEGLFAARLYSGRWSDCVSDLTHVLNQLSSNMQYRGGATELALGVAYTYSGRGSQAIDTLLGAKAQMEVTANSDGLELIYAVLSFAYAQVEDVRKARYFLQLVAECRNDYQMPWFQTSMGEFCTLMARRWLNETGAKANLLESAHNDVMNGRYTTASISLFGATVHGTDEEYLQLEQVSSHRQGPMAELNRMTGEGSRTRDPKILLQAASLASELRLDAVESRCVVMALDIAHEKADVLTARVAQSRLDRLVMTVPLLPLVPRTDGPELTQRERQVASLARRGLSNRDVAEHLQVSVRTVEGHLYQVFTKLGISSRSELI